MTVPEVGPYDRSGLRYDFVASPASASRAFFSSGATGLLTVRSGPSGAQPAVVAADRAKRDVLTLAALREPIGAPNRWMAMTTDGRRLLAVHAPHVGGVLYEYVRDGNALRARTTRAKKLRKRDQQVHDKHEEFAHGANRTMTASARESARHWWIRSYCEFATHRVRRYHGVS